MSEFKYYEDLRELNKKVFNLEKKLDDNLFAIIVGGALILAVTAATLIEGLNEKEEVILKVHYEEVKDGRKP